MDSERIPRGLATGLESECNNKKLLTLDSLRSCRREDQLAGWRRFIAPVRVEWNVRRLILLCHHFLVLLKRDAAFVLG